MKLRNLAQSALRKTSTALLNAESKLESTPQDDMVHLLKKADIPTPILLEALDLIKDRLDKLEADNA